MDWQKIILALVAVIGTSLSIILYLVKKPSEKNEEHERRSGDKPVEFWEQAFDRIIENRIHPLIAKIEMTERNLHEFLVSRDRDWNNLTSTLASIRTSLHGIRNSLLVMRGMRQIKEDEDV